jgi:SLIDE
MERIVKGERRIQRSQEIRTALEKKVARHKNPWQQMSISYGGAKGKAWHHYYYY